MAIDRAKFFDGTPEEGTIYPLYPLDGKEQWYKGHDFNRTPSKSELRAAGLESIMLGWKPTEPIIHPESKVIAFGSCFAAYFIEWLAEHGYNQAVEGSPYNGLI